MRPTLPAPALALALAVLVGATAATGQTAPPLTGAEFEAYATGKTLTYAQNGSVWGTERYLPDRRVLWSFAGQSCQSGIWYEDKGNICFSYADDPAPQCWRFYRDAAGLMAEFTGDGPPSPLSKVRPAATPLHCTGPETGA